MGSDPTYTMAYRLCVSLWVILCLFCIGKGQEVYSPRHDDVCTIECSETDSRYWCGGVKEDSTGRVMRCVQYTQKGQTCVAECGGKKKKYNWCLTNAYHLSEGDWWDYCSLVGYTINKAPCTDECEQRGENYFWCHTNKDGDWDYCSPPGLVKPVQFTVKGVPCISECRQEGENYHWCYRSKTHCTDDSCDEDWDYCSLDDQHTRYNHQCDGPCSSKGENYYWCKQGSSWEYCSPTPKIGVHFSENIELTIYGIKCRDKCGLKGEDYYWCSVYGRGYTLNHWGYCSPDPATTRYKGKKCKDACESRGKSYYWCNTDSSWEYCSPAYKIGMVGFENLAAGGNLVTGQFGLIGILSCFLLTCFREI